MKVSKEYFESDGTETTDRMEADGMIFIYHQWIEIKTVVHVFKETEKAFYGDVVVYECDGDEKLEILFDKEKTWIPKSMCKNPWWICTIMFDHPDKVANRRFDKKW